MVDLVTASRALAGAAGLVLLVLAYRSTRIEKPAARSFGVLLSILGITAFCAAATAHTGTPYKLVWLYTGLAIPMALVVFAFDYSGLGFFAARSRLATALVPAVGGAVGGTAVVLGTPNMSPGAAAPVAALVDVSPVVVDVATALNEIGLYYTTAVMILAVGIVVRTIYRYEHLDTRLGLVVAFVGIWPWLANLLVPQITASFGFGLGLAGVGVGYAASVALSAVAIGPLALFESSPMAGNVGPDVVLDSIDAAVLVVDEDGTVLRLNELACETFGTSVPDAAGGPLSAVMDRRLADLGGGETVSIDTVGGRRQFEVTRSPVTDRTGEDRGWAIVMRDVTRRQTREQRLEVFNRILRHNVRNEATSIIGNAELVGDGGDPEACADRIVDTTRSLVEVAERAREIDRMMSATPAETALSVTSVIEDVAAEVETTYPDVAITTALPDDAVAAVSQSVFDVVVRNLIENAAAHNDADEPIVVVSADLTDDALVLSIADNGPGIPEHERAVIAAGEEGPLEHGSGLGLWAVSWGVRKMGGALEFSENQPRGSVVTVTLPVDPERAIESMPSVPASAAVTRPESPLADSEGTS